MNMPGVGAVGMVVCGGASIAMTVIGAALAQVPSSPWVEGGAVGLAAAMIWFWRKDGRDRERNLSTIIERHRREMNDLQAAHREDIRTLLAENISVMRNVAEAVRKCPRREGPEDGNR